MKLFYLHNAYFRNSQAQVCTGPWTIAMSDLSAIRIVMLIASRDLTPGPGPSSPWSPPAPSHSLGRGINCVISHHEECQWSPGMSGGPAICQQFLLWRDTGTGGSSEWQPFSPWPWSQHGREDHSKIDSCKTEIRPDQTRMLPVKLWSNWLNWPCHTMAMMVPVSNQKNLQLGFVELV